MVRRSRKALWGRSLQAALKAMTRTALRAGSTVVKQTLRAAPAAVARDYRKRKHQPAQAQQVNWHTGFAIGPQQIRRYQLYVPPGAKRTERLPLMVMLHGCGQDAYAFAASTRMNRVAVRERFLVLYPEQDRLSNLQACWNWYETRNGKAQAEAATIDAAIRQVCARHAVDEACIALVGFSAGAGMAALLALLHPGRFRALAMHSGVAPGKAHSSATALNAMRGRRSAAILPARIIASAELPPLLVIHGSMDTMVVSHNGSEAVRLWAAPAEASAGMTRVVQRGSRHAACITDYRSRGRLVASLCEVRGMGHAWSGGAAGQAFSDPKGPDASRMIWTFVAKQFRRNEPGGIPARDAKRVRQSQARAKPG